jgi:hypothetical protein
VCAATNSSLSLKLFPGDAQLPKDFEKEGWPDLSSTVEGNGDGAPVGMIPAFVTAGLPCLGKAQTSCHGL